MGHDDARSLRSGSTLNISGFEGVLTNTSAESQRLVLLVRGLGVDSLSRPLEPLSFSRFR
jgi:hypothetical protein